MQLGISLAMPKKTERMFVRFQQVRFNEIGALSRPEVQGEKVDDSVFPNRSHRRKWALRLLRGPISSKKWAGAQITIFEALPVPYGLIRYGVAADHQGSKAVIQQFERMFEKGGVEFRGM